MYNYYVKRLLQIDKVFSPRPMSWSSCIMNDNIIEIETVETSSGWLRCENSLISALLLLMNWFLSKVDETINQNKNIILIIDLVNNLESVICHLTTWTYYGIGWYWYNRRMILYTSSVLLNLICYERLQLITFNQFNRLWTTISYNIPLWTSYLT